MITIEERLKAHKFDTDNERLYLIAKIAAMQYAEQLCSELLTNWCACKFGSPSNASEKFKREWLENNIK